MEHNGDTLRSGRSTNKVCELSYANIQQLENKGFKDATIKVEPRGDGTCIGKILNVVNFPYTILHERPTTMTEPGSYVLAI